MLVRAGQGTPTGSFRYGELMDSSSRIRWAVALWLPAAVAVTVAAGAGYGVGQNLLRSSANDPQIQMAEDAAAELTAGADAASVATGPPVDLATSLAVEITVLDDAGTVLASTGRLDGKQVHPPSGALEAAGRRSHIVTWQPRRDVRMAAVIAAYTGDSGSGTVVVSRSLRVVEQRETQVLALVAAGWGGGLVATALAAVVGAYLLPPSSRTD